MRTIALIALAGCGGNAQRPELINVSPPAVGCPPAENVRMASFEAADGRGWFLPLGTQVEDALDPTDPDESSSRPMTEQEATTFMPSSKLRPWLMVPGHAPCEMTFGAPYLQIVADGIRNRSFRVELDGCPTPKATASKAVVVFSDSRPSDCTVVTSREISSFHDYSGATKPGAVPAELRTFVGTPNAKQKLLWRIRAIDVRGTDAFWSIDTSLITIGKPGNECDWDASNLGMFYERSSGAIVPFSAQHTSRTMEAYQYLYGALIERERIHSIVVTNLGEYQVYDLTRTPHPIGYHLRWYMPNAEDYASDGVLGPYCGP